LSPSLRSENDRAGSSPGYRSALYPASENAICPNMKKTTLEKILWSLERMQPEVRVSGDIRVKATGAVDRMVEVL